MAFNADMPPIPQHQRQAGEFYPDENQAMLANAVELVKRGSNDDKVLRNIMDTWMVGSNTAFKVLQQAKKHATDQESEIRTAQEAPAKNRTKAGPAAPAKPSTPTITPTKEPKTVPGKPGHPAKPRTEPIPKAWY